MADFKFSKVIAFSNSVPKSGSTLLYQYQSYLLNGVFDLPRPGDVLDKLEVPNVGGFIVPDQPGVFELLTDPDFESGPLMLKLHKPVRGRLLTAMQTNPHLYMTLIIRDPMDVFLSATDNFHRTAEFKEFATTESGLRTVNNMFRDILTSVRDLNDTIGDKGRKVNVVRYENLLSQPAATVLDSFPHRLRRNLTVAMTRQNLSDEAVKQRAAHRLQAGQPKRDLSAYSNEFIRDIQTELADIREYFGYGDSEVAAKT